MKNKRVRKRLLIAATVIALAGSVVAANDQRDGEDDERDIRFGGGRRARNVILFIGDGMGVSTVAATRVFSVGVAGQLAMDQFPYTALSRTYSADSITPDSAPTMSAMMTGVNTNQSVIGFDAKTEPNDFNQRWRWQSDMDAARPGEARGMKVGVVSTARSPMRRQRRRTRISISGQ